MTSLNPSDLIKPLHL